MVEDPRFGCEERRSDADALRLNDRVRLARARVEYERKQAERRERRLERIEMVAGIETDPEGEENADPETRGPRISPLRAVGKRGFGFAWKAAKNFARRL